MRRILSGQFEWLRSLLEERFPQRPKLRDIVKRDDVIAGQLAGATGKRAGAIRDEKFRLAASPGIQQQLSWLWKGQRVLGRNAESGTERDPARLAAPPRMHGVAFERKELHEQRHGFGRRVFFEPPGKGEGSYRQPNSIC